MAPLRLGCVKYRNARPLIRGWTGPVQFDHPAVLCRQLALGELDVALVSSFEFLRNPTYRIVDGISISSDGPVYSVVLAHRDQLAEIRDVVLDPASQTSVALLRYLLHQRGLAPKLVEGSTRDGVIGHGVGRLLIGDQALRFRRDQPEVSVWDLGAAWQAVAALPFVYALWLVRPEVNNAGEIATRLRQIRNANMAELASIAGEEDEFDSAFLTRYYTQHLRFNFADRDKRGLQAFADACANLGLLPKREFALNLV